MKVAVSVGVVLTASEMGERIRALAGLVATIPLTSLLVPISFYADMGGGGR